MKVHVHTTELHGPILLTKVPRLRGSAETARIRRLSWTSTGRSEWSLEEPFFDSGSKANSKANSKRRGAERGYYKNGFGVYVWSTWSLWEWSCIQVQSDTRQLVIGHATMPQDGRLHSICQPFAGIFALVVLGCDRRRPCLSRCSQRTFTRQGYHRLIRYPLLYQPHPKMRLR